MASKEIRTIVDLLLKQGWVVEEGKHYKAFPPDKTKPVIVFAKTPSDHRALANIRSRLRKAGADV